MAIKSKYCYRSRISDAKFRELVRFFSLDIEANKTAVLIHLNRNTVNRYYQMIRKCIADHCVKNSLLEKMVFVDSSDRLDCSVPIECSLNGKPKFFGICLLDGKIHTEILPKAFEIEAQHLTNRNYDAACLVDWSRWDRYVGLVDLCSGRHYRISHNGARCEQASNLFRTSELFWGFVKNRLMKFNGIHDSTFYLHVKECEFRFNHRREDIYSLLLRLVRSNPLN